MRRAGVVWVVFALLLSASPLFATSAGSDARGDYGVTLAISGDEARAESVFVSMLSHTRGDARALNNLGNLRLLHGETGVALAFYERALRGDSLDAGIHLNRATALMLIGDRERAERAFSFGVRLAGGLDRAQSLMGLTAEPAQPTDRAARKTAIDAEQLRAMLRQAAASVPSDTSRGVPGAARAATGRHPSAWRSAGARASDGEDTPGLLYWKR